MTDTAETHDFHPITRDEVLLVARHADIGEELALSMFRVRAPADPRDVKHLAVLRRVIVDNALLLRRIALHAQPTDGRVEYRVEWRFPGSFVAEHTVHVCPAEHIPTTTPLGTYGPGMAWRILRGRVLTSRREDGKITESFTLDTAGPWTYYGELRTLADVEKLAAADPRRWDTLLSNMKGNGWNRVVSNGMTLPLDPEDRCLPLTERPPLAARP